MALRYALLLLSVACSVAPLDEGAEQSLGPYGTTWGPSCAFAPPVLDPRWTADERAEIRAAAWQWADATGAELGELPVADEPCEPGVTPACIAVGDDDAGVVYASDSYSGIALYRERIAASSYTLGVVALHELGHYVGIDEHITVVCSDRYVMSACGDLPTELSRHDVALWRLTCHPVAG